MSDLVRRDTDTWTDVLPAVGDLAGKIATTDFVPEAMRGKPAVVAAAILYGRELGLPPMTALRSVNVIKGKPALTAEAMRAMVLAAGHDIRFQEMTGARCVVVGRRKGSDESTTVTFTMDDAKKMGVSGGQQYSKMPRQMLAARATSELCRLVFADVIGGLISDVEAEDDEPGQATATVTPITTARRAKAPKSEVAESAPPVAEPDIVVDPEPVLDDDVIEAEIVDDLVPDTAEAVATIREVMDADIIDDHPSGIALARQALNDAKSGKPAPITKPQLMALQAGFKECGVDSRVERLRIAAALAGRPDLASANDLTSVEAAAVLEGLAFAKASDDPLAILKEATS